MSTPKKNNIQSQKTKKKKNSKDYDNFNCFLKKRTQKKSKKI